MVVDGCLCAFQVRDNLNEVAETWTDEQKEHCLQETTESFKVGRMPCIHPDLSGAEKWYSCHGTLLWQFNL
jgi:hypothetical protein